MTAPPHAHAQSFAKAILTDITASLFLTLGGWMKARADIHSPPWQ